MSSQGIGWEAWTRDEEALYLEFAKPHVAGTAWPIHQMNIAAITRKLDCRLFTPRILEQKASREESQAVEERKVENDEGFAEWKREQTKKRKKEEDRRAEEARKRAEEERDEQERKLEEENRVWEEETRREREQKRVAEERLEVEKKWAEERLRQDMRDEIIDTYIQVPSIESYTGRRSPAPEKGEEEEDYLGCSFSATDMPMCDGSGSNMTTSEWAIYMEYANIKQPHRGWPIERMNAAARERGLFCRPFTTRMLDHEFRNHPNYLPQGDRFDAGGFHKPKRSRRTVLRLGNDGKVEQTAQQAGATEDRGKEEEEEEEEVEGGPHYSDEVDNEVDSNMHVGSGGSRRNWRLGKGGSTVMERTKSL